MSKIFYDKLLALKEIDREIKKVAKTPEEREELWAIVDEIIHHEAMGCLLDRLPREHHEEFLTLFHKSPHDEELLFGYLRDKAGSDIEEQLKKEIDKLSKTLWTEITET